MNTKKAKTEKAELKERRSVPERRKDERRDTVRDADKGILSTRKDERRKSGRRTEDRENND